VSKARVRSSFPDGRLARGLILLGGVGTLSAQTFARAFRKPWLVSALAAQIVDIGLRSVSIVILTAVFSSMVMTVQFALQLSRFGAKGWVGTVIGVSLARELAPVLTALTVGGRVGAGIAAELGSMAVTEQVEAMRALGADPVQKLVVPRVLASVLVLPLMTAMAVAIGVLGGATIASLDAGVNFTHFYNSAVHAVTISDLLSGLAKSAFFGFNIAIVGCYLGLTTRGGTQGVGRSTTTTVVITSIVTLISDFFLTKLILELGVE
jgi:phospholipid/cholesterol/gamma-HCH transport system permease protein